MSACTRPAVIFGYIENSVVFRKDENNKAILLKETTFVIWNEAKTELGFTSKGNNEFAEFLLAKCGDDDKMSDISSESDAERKKPAGKGERLF